MYSDEDEDTQVQRHTIALLTELELVCMAREIEKLAVSLAGLIQELESVGDSRLEKVANLHYDLHRCKNQALKIAGRTND